MNRAFVCAGSSWFLKSIVETFLDVSTRIGARRLWSVRAGTGFLITFAA